MQQYFLSETSFRKTTLLHLLHTFRRFYKQVYDPSSFKSFKNVLFNLNFRDFFFKLQWVSQVWCFRTHLLEGLAVVVERIIGTLLDLALAAPEATAESKGFRRETKLGKGVAPLRLGLVLGSACRLRLRLIL